MQGPELHSIVVPMFDEALVARDFIARCTAAMAEVSEWELIVVDDASGDDTFRIVSEAAAADPRIRVVRFARNFGHQTAITAGIDLARGDTVTTIDADLQDPPELIPEMIAKWREGADVVFAVRTEREGDSWFKRTSARGFYRALRKVAGVDIPLDAGDFRLMSRRAAAGLRGMRERSRYIRGLVGWMGMQRAFVEYRRGPRLAGESKYPLSKMTKLAADGIVSFSTRPLQLATYMGFVASGLGFLYGIYTLWYWLTTRHPVQGWTSLMIVVLFFGGVQLITLGIVGEYVGRIYDEVRGRPLYTVAEVEGFEPDVTEHFAASVIGEDDARRGR